jgi:predicted RNase H-like HicB family nuclease
MRYLVVVERGRTGWGAHVPDLPGCAAAAASRDEVLELIQDALARHIRDLRVEGLPVPPATASAEMVDVDR